MLDSCALFSRHSIAMPLDPKPSPLPPPLPVLELLLRLEGCQSEQEKRQRLSPLMRHWGRMAHIAIREEQPQREPNRAALTIVVCSQSEPEARREMDDLLAWCERNLSAWIETYQVSSA